MSDLIGGLPMFLAQAAPGSDGGGVFHPVLDQTVVQMILMWFHFVAGIIWIGHLYFFNFVNVHLMKVLDGPTKGKVIPQLMPRALWWFRWGALVTVLGGLTYYAMYMVAVDTRNANSLANAGANPWVVLLVWLLVVVVTFAILMYATRSTKSGITLAVIVSLVVMAMAVVNLYWLSESLSGTTTGGMEQSYASNRTLSIGIGGGLGIIMLLNVWGIIWPAQKRIIAWTYDNAEKGAEIPAESATLARRAFLASRMNTWLSIPMLFFMGASQYLPAMFGK